MIQENAVIEEIKNLLGNYQKHLSIVPKFEVKFPEKGVPDWVEVVTPFLDSHNDYISVYVLKTGDDSFILSDDGNILWARDTSSEADRIFLQNVREIFKVIINNKNEVKCLVNSKYDLFKVFQRYIQVLVLIDEYFNFISEGTGKIIERSVFDERDNLVK